LLTLGLVKSREEEDGKPTTASKGILKSTMIAMFLPIVVFKNP